MVFVCSQEPFNKLGFDSRAYQKFKSLRPMGYGGRERSTSPPYECETSPYHPDEKLPSVVVIKDGHLVYTDHLKAKQCSQ